jgi:hypothetical protein
MGLCARNDLASNGHCEEEEKKGSGQVLNYFVQKGGYRQGTPDDLPPARRQRYDKSRRRSLVLTKKL